MKRRSRRKRFHLNKQKRGGSLRSVPFVSFVSEGKGGELFGDVLRGFGLIEDMRINFLGSAEAGMTEGKLNVADVGSAVGPKGGRAMAEKVGVDVPSDDALSVSFDEAIEGGGVELVPEFVLIL